MFLDKQLALLTALMFIFSIVALPTSTSLAQEVEKTDDKVKTEILLRILEKARERVKDIFERFEEKGATIPEEAKTSYETGLSIADEAIRLSEEGRYGEASKKAIEAMQMFKEAIKIAHKATPEKLTMAENVTLKAIGLKVAINRSYSFIEKFESLVNKAELEGYNLTTVRGKIDAARTHLENALTALEEGDVDTAAKELATARANIGQAVGEFHKIVKTFKIRKVKKFIEKAEERIIELRERVEALPIPSLAKVKVLMALRMAEENIRKAKEFLKLEDVKDVIRQLEKFKKKEEESFEALGKETAKTLRKIGKLEGIVLALERKIRVLADTGVNVSEAEDAIKNAKSLMKEALVQVRLGNSEAAKEALEKAEEAINSVKDFLKQVEEEAREKVKEKIEEKLGKLSEKISRLMEKIDSLKEKNMDTSRIEKMLHEAIDKLDKAKEAVEKNKLETAEFLLSLAENILDRIEELLEHLEEKLSEIEERIYELNQTIQELNDKLKTLQDEVANAEEQGVEVSAVKTKLERVRDLIEKAEKNIRERLPETATSAISMAEELIEDAEETLKEKLEIAKEKIETALRSIKETIKNTETKLEKLEEQGVNVSQAKTKLEEVKSLTEQIETKIEAGDFKDAWKLLEKAEGALGEVEALLEELSGRIPGKAIKKHT